MGKNPCAVFGCNNNRLFLVLVVLEIWSFSVYFSGKRRFFAVLNNPLSPNLSINRQLKMNATSMEVN